MEDIQKAKQDYQELERQRKILRRQLYRMIAELNEQTVERRYQPFPFGILDRMIGRGIDNLEDHIQRLVEAIEKLIPKSWSEKCWSKDRWWNK